MDKIKKYSQLLHLDDDQITKRGPDGRRVKDEISRSAEETRKKIREVFSHSEKLKASLRA